MDLKPGTLLDKAEICTRLGISRSPVVAAFARLEAEGLLDIIPQRGTVVTFISIEVVKELVFIRQALECEAVRAIAPDRDEALLDALAQSIEHQRQAAGAGDLDAFHGQDLIFHQALSEALGYPRLGAIVTRTRNNLDRARQITMSPARFQPVIDQHTEILAALRDRDGQLAAAHMHAHLESIVVQMTEVRKRRPELFERSLEHLALSAIRQSATNRLASSS